LYPHIDKASFVSHFVSFAVSIAETARGENLCTQSLAQLISCPEN